jgi:AmmeMemoRadiSam system protein A
VVGYGSFVINPPNAFGADAGATLIALAKAAIDTQLGGNLASPADQDWLRRSAATFVTLTRNDELRGCIGSLEAKRALAEDVRENALGAAFRDPRFKPLTAAEWIDTWVEVSVLSAMEPIAVESEPECCAICARASTGWCSSSAAIAARFFRRSGSNFRRRPRS